MITRLKTSILLRMTIVGVLTLALLLPAIWIQSLIDERQNRRNEAVKEVSSNWGESQKIIGPVLSIPYRKRVIDEKGITSIVIRAIHILPEQLSVNGSMHPEIRRRGIYSIPLYSSRLFVTGTFLLPDFNQYGIAPDELMWKESVINYGISDLKGIRELVQLNWNDDVLVSTPGVSTGHFLKNGISFRPKLFPSKDPISFSFELNLNGSSEVCFVPVGRQTEIELSGSWNSPGFIGSFLPGKRTIDNQGFTSHWKVLDLNRNFPQAWTVDHYSLEEPSFGVRLVVPVDHYQQTTRSVKYALLFIALTFLSFFLVEVIGKELLHPVHYALIGFALMLFYVLLTSLSEHLSFTIAYSIASLSIIMMITLYTMWITSQRKIPVFILVVLSILYTMLYVILQAEDYALLLGSGLLFTALFVVMYLTRRIDWYAPTKAIE